MATATRTLNPALNPTGWMATAGAVYAGTLMLYNTVNHHGAWSTPVFIALVAAVASLLTRQVVTPVADPVDGAGRPLAPVPPPILPPVPPDAAVRVIPAGGDPPAAP